MYTLTYCRNELGVALDAPQYWRIDTRPVAIATAIEIPISQHHHALRFDTLLD
jgi:hypothetical protein